MTVVVVIFLPLVLDYQAWTYYVFRRRVSASEFQPPARPQAPERPSPGPPRRMMPRPGTATGWEPTKPGGTTCLTKLTRW